MKLPNNSKPCRLRGTRHALATLLCVAAAGYMEPANSMREDTVTVPIVSIQVITNTCESWTIMQTYTATPVPKDVLRDLEGYNYYNYGDHYHAAGTGTSANGSWGTFLPMSGDGAEKLRTINKSIFGTTNPSPGQRAVFDNRHGGNCAHDQGMRECVGVFVHANSGTHVTPSSVPTTFPAGFCSGIPPASGSCTFDAPTASIDLGTGGKGPRAGGVTVAYSCTKPTTYRVSYETLPDDQSGIQVQGITMDGNPLPYVGSMTSAGTQHSRVEVEAVVTREGTLGTSRVLFIDIP